MQVYACYPLKIDEKTIGTMAFGSKYRTSFKEDELELIKTISFRIAGAIQRKQDEDAIRQNEIKFRSVLESSRDIITRFNLQTKRPEYVSPSCEDITGYSQQEFMDMDHTMAIKTVSPG